MTTTKKTSAAAANFDPTAGFNPETLQEGYKKLSEGFTTMADFQKSSLEAVMASAGAFAKGLEKVTTEQASFVKAAYEDGVATAKAASTAKSVQDAIEINSDFVRESVEKNLGQLNKVTDMMIETAKETTEPLSSSYSDLVEKIQSYRP